MRSMRFREAAAGYANKKGQGDITGPMEGGLLKG